MTASVNDAQARIAVFRDWCTQQGFVFQSEMRIAPDPYDGIGMYSGEKAIPAGTTVVHIPKTAVLSVRNCHLSKSIAPLSAGTEAQLNLTLALYSEILLGPKSKWHGYLQSLPGVVEMPLIWQMKSPQGSVPTSAQDSDRITALEWLRGTEVLKVLQEAKCEGGKTIQGTLLDFYNTTGEPLLLSQQYPQEVSFDGFLRSYTLVSSRAFLVDAYHGLAMVPVADVFNHVQENHLHIESNYHVCHECGSLDECPHDREDQAPVFNDKGRVTDNYYEMVANTDIPPDTEVFNTYGETLSNAELMVRYGFTLDANDNDRISWELDEVFAYFGASEDARADISWRVKDLLTWGSFMNNAHDSPVVSVPPEGAPLLCIDSDGHVSVGLFLTLLMLAGFEVGRPFREEPHQLKEMMETLELLASATDPEGETAADMYDMFFDTIDIRYMKALKRQAEMMVELCEQRVNGLGKAGYRDAEEVGNYLDALDDAHPCTKRSVLVVLNEMSIIGPCQHQFESFAQFLDQFTRAPKK